MEILKGDIVLIQETDNLERNHPGPRRASPNKMAELVTNHSKNGAFGLQVTQVKTLGVLQKTGLYGFNVKGFNYNIFVTSDIMRCFACKSNRHLVCVCVEAQKKDIGASGSAVATAAMTVRTTTGPVVSLGKQRAEPQQGPVFPLGMQQAE